MLLWLILAFVAGGIVMALVYFGSSGSLRSSASHAGVLLTN